MKANMNDNETTNLEKHLSTLPGEKLWEMRKGGIFTGRLIGAGGILAILFMLIFQTTFVIVIGTIGVVILSFVSLAVDYIVRNIEAAIKKIPFER
jgi:hypothetical protein